MIYTAEFFSTTDRCHSFPGNDITYLPNLEGTIDDLSTLTGDKEWVRDVLPNLSPTIMHYDMLATSALRMKFEKHMDIHGAEPAWTSRLGLEQRKYLRRGYAIGDADLYWAVPNVPLAGMGYFTEDGGLTQDVANTFGIQRLGNIKQLGRLHDPIVTDRGETIGYGTMFDHNRLTHSLDVRAIALLMAENNHLPVKERITLEVAGLTHDTLTPAYGDGTKAIDPDYFDEDLHYRRLFKRQGWPVFQEKYGLDEELLAATVEGKGTLGTLLDIADKLAYLSRDVDVYVRKYGPNGPIVYPGNYREVAALVEKRRYVFGLWGTARVAGGEVFVEDGEWLGDVLLIRAHMFKNLYHHPGARFLERITGIIFLKYLIDRGEVSKQQLLTLGDSSLDRIMAERFGDDMIPNIVGMGGLEPRVEVFPTIEAARSRESELIASGMQITFIDEHPAAKPGTHLKVKASSGAIVPFADAFPERAAEIDAILRSTKTVKLNYLDLGYNELSGPFKEIADALRATKKGV